MDTQANEFTKLDFMKSFLHCVCTFLNVRKKDFNKFLDKFIVLAEKDLQTTKLLLQKGDAKICIKYSKLDIFVSHLQLISDVLP